MHEFFLLKQRYGISREHLTCKVFLFTKEGGEVWVSNPVQYRLERKKKSENLM